MDRTLKAISLLLSYPTREIQSAMPEISGVLTADSRLTAAARRALRPLLEEMRDQDIYDLEERYVLLFDRSRTLSLNLFEHIHGESRDRGGAMVSLLETYREGGFEPATSELPDHLPVLLEFLSTQKPNEAKEILEDAAHLLEALRQRLERRESSYAPLFAALGQLAGAKINRATIAELMEEPEVDPNDLESLDEVWEESEVRFGPDPDAGCPVSRELLAKMAVPANPPPPHAAE